VTGSLFLPNTTGPFTGTILIGGTPVLYTLPPSSCLFSPPIIPECGRNFFVGPSAGNFTMTGNDNTATGDEALDSITLAHFNTATGSRALRYNTTGGGNTATGAYALYSNTAGGANVATGDLALYSNTTGSANVATGSQALFSNTTGSINTAMGDTALSGNTTGYENIAMGSQALGGNTTGHDNIAMGIRALCCSNKGGSFNIAIGYGAGILSGDGNIDIGFDVGGVLSESNTLRIGTTDPALGPGVNRAFIGGIYGVPTGLPGAAVFVDANGQLGTMSSSRRFKDDIQDMGDASSDLTKLRPVTFRYKQAQEDGSHPLQYGLVAEEVAEVNPGLVQFDKEGQPQTVLYHVLPALLLNEVQKEHQHMDAQEKVIQSQQKLIESQQEQLKGQEERLRKLEAILSSKEK
jgi:Chaperone of endosialidase